MKKVLDIITGIGYGHSIRESAILNNLKEYDISVAGYANSYEYFEKKFKTLQLLGPKFPERKFKFSLTMVIFKNLLLPFKYVINYFKLKNLNPDIIISDFEPIAFSIAKQKPHFLIFNFNPDLYKEYIKNRKKKFRLQYLYIDRIYKKAIKKNIPIIIPSISGYKENKHIFYINPIVRKLQKKTNALKKFKEPVLISLGGSYFGSEILDKLLHILPEFKQNFIIFGYKTIGKSRKNMHFMSFKENFLSYLKASKAIICLGGHNTLSEAVVLRKPILVFPVPNFMEQTINGYEIEKNNFGLSKILKYPLKDEEIRETIRKFLSNLETYEHNLNKAKIKGDGAEQVLKIIEEKIK